MTLFPKTLTVLGDSFADYTLGNVAPRELAPYLLTRHLLADRGLSIGNRVFGKSGDTSTLALARADVIGMCETPDILLVEIGVNDPGNSIVQATTQANIQAIVKAAKFGAYGPGAGFGGPVAVADQTALPAIGRPGQRYVVLADGDSTGGIAKTSPGQATTITGAGGGAQTVWEYRYPQAGARGWGRIATAATPPTGCKRIAVISAPYLNFTAGGDAPASPYATYTPVRAAQQAAVTAENVAVGGAPSVIYVDLYGFLRARIVAGTDPDFTQVAYAQATSWHVANSNQHFDPYGQSLMAEAVAEAIDTAGWIVSGALI